MSPPRDPTFAEETFPRERAPMEKLELARTI
jgi:hypothetical protein